jgi:molybdopterin/thiamine biosynthesis adenylyltransferase
VLGILPGVIGLLQAVEAIKILLGIGRNLSGRILKYDALHHDFSMLEVEKEPHCLCSQHPDQIAIVPIESQVCAV